MSSKKINLHQHLADATQKAQDAGPLVRGEPAPTEEPAPEAAAEPRKKPRTSNTKKAVDTPATAPSTTPTRPSRHSEPGEKPVRAATLIKASLYEKIKAIPGIPFGQLITWACLDRADEVVADALAELAATQQISRIPRGVGAAGAREATKQIAPRFLPEENALVLDVLQRIKDEAAQKGIDPAKATRTMLHSTALTVYLRHYDPNQGEHG